MSHNMEEGCEISPSNNMYNKDHIATATNSLVARVENNEQWLVCGFNGFGQFNIKNKRKLQWFEEFQMPLNIKGSLRMACSWNCLAIAGGYSLLLQGFISNTPTFEKSVKVEVPIKSIDICDKYCLVLLENGRVYKLLPESDDGLKEIIFQTNLKSATTRKRNIFGGTKHERPLLEIVRIACGNNITVAVSKTNVIFSGTTEIFQLSKHEHVKQLECGFEHALLLTSNGDVYAWGNGLRGQLGLEALRIEEIPTLIEALAGIKITHVAAGGWHSAAISAFGDLYTWGFNSNGQLGLRLYKMGVQNLKEPSVFPLPQVICLPRCECIKNTHQSENCCPVKVMAGTRHTVLQMICGSVYASGWNFYGQLGLTKPQENCDNFVYIIKLEAKHFSENRIICGNWCTIIKK